MRHSKLILQYRGIQDAVLFQKLEIAQFSMIFAIILVLWLSFPTLRPSFTENLFILKFRVNCARSKYFLIWVKCFKKLNFHENFDLIVFDQK